MTDSTLPPVIQAMLQPEFYPHPVQTPIRLVQTHISYVLLTGDYAYKVKKPMNFGFLDFTTLEKRQHFCQEELRLNKRGAADLYLEVLPIAQTNHQTSNQTGNQFQLGSTPAVEYTLKMQQFPEESLLTNVFERGELTVERLQELAGAIAEYHAKSETSDYIRSFGKVEQVRQAFDENYEQTAGYIGGPQTQQQFDETKAYSDRFFAERADLFAERMAQDKIREYHGDPHLGNICEWQGQLQLFDCIEFNEPFRFVDAMYDVAFIVMDLTLRQSPDLSAAFLNAYVEKTGDWEGLQVLPIYISRQTYVRAKVTSFLLNDPNISAEAKAKASETAAMYYRLAWEYTQPKQGRVMMMSGLSGSGKSTTARQIAQKLGAIQLRSDAVRKHLGGVSLYEKGGADLYTAEMTQKTYDRLLTLGITLAYAGYTVILDGVYAHQAVRGRVIAEAQGHDLPIQIIHCDAPIEVLKERVRKRTGDIADATVEVLEQQSLEPFSESEQAIVVTIDTTKDVEPQIAGL
jgi:uncharacterized protein